MSDLYLIRLGDTQYFKIGKSDYPEERFSSLKAACSDLILVASYKGLAYMEARLHREYAASRCNPPMPVPKSGNTEWFKLSDTDVLNIQRQCNLRLENPIQIDRVSRTLLGNIRGHWNDCCLKKRPYLCIQDKGTYSNVTIDLDPTYWRGHTYAFTEEQRRAIVYLLNGFHEGSVTGGSSQITVWRASKQQEEMIASILWNLWLWCLEETGERYVPEGELYASLSRCA